MRSLILLSVLMVCSVSQGGEWTQTYKDSLSHTKRQMEEFKRAQSKGALHIRNQAIEAKKESGRRYGPKCFCLLMGRGHHTQHIYPPKSHGTVYNQQTFRRYPPHWGRSHNSGSQLTATARDPYNVQYYDSK